NSNETKEKIAHTRDKSSGIKESLEKIQDELKGKKRLEWNDENKLDDIIRKKEELNEALEQLREQNEVNNLQQDRFGKQNQKIKEQQKLAEETSQSKREIDEELKQRQEEINNAFEQKREDISNLHEINQELKNPNPLQDLGNEQKQIEQEQGEINKALEKNQSRQAAKHQQKASEQMKAMGEKLAQMQNSMEMEMLQENLDHLRDILDNLVKLSFNQEGLMQEFRQINQ